MFTNARIINAYTTLDEIMQREDRLDIMEEKLGYEMEDMFELGSFYEWAKHIVNDDSVDLDALTEVPDIWGEYIPQLETIR